MPMLARMPELAEVEYYRKQWDAGLGARVTRVHFHPGKRVLRGTDAALNRLAGQKLLESRAAAKQMLFHFSDDLWLGVHLGMTGRLSAGAASHDPTKHEHLILFQAKRSLIFEDARQFGRILLHEGGEEPRWWAKIPPAVTSPKFTLERVEKFLQRRAKLPAKAALLMQQAFPGIGNWMADEILWRANLAPSRACGSLDAGERRALWRETRWVARAALKTIGVDFRDPPKGWFFHARWGRGGLCPKHQSSLERATIGGRTTAWCARCQA